MLAKKLREMNACSEAVEWVADRDLATAWAECERSDWMHWLLCRLEPPQNTMILIACDHAERAIPHAGKYTDLCRSTLTIARGVVAGTHTKKQALAATEAASEAAVRAAVRAAEAAVRAAEAAVRAAEAAVRAAVRAASEAADGAAVRAAEAAVRAAVRAADGAAVRAAAWAAARKTQADIIRKYISPEQVVALWAEST
jgi:hypothetical protein